jgi:hypothetical protein
LGTIVKDMGLTPADFFRGLESAFRGFDYRVEGHTVTAGRDGCGVSVSIRPLPPRRLSGLLSMARCEVTISFQACDEEQQETFLEGFDRAYQRGGG